MTRLLSIGLIVFMGGLVGCFHDELSTDPLPGNPNIIKAFGTIRYIDLEGGFYGIITANDERYLPMNLSLAFQRDGMRVSFEARILTDTATIQQWGTPVEILKMERTY